MNHLPTQYFAAFGRTFVDNTTSSYQLSHEIGASLAAHHIGVITGGYAGGLMEAVARGATEYATKQSWSHPYEYAHGVPVAEFDKDHEHITHTRTLPSKNTTIERLQHFSEYANGFIALPEGGFGTFDEIIHVIRENVTHAITPKPLILVGSHWMCALECVFETIGSKKHPRDFSWLYVVNTIEEFREVLTNLLTETNRETL